MQDIWDLDKHLFSQKAQELMGHQIKNTVHQYNERTDILQPPYDPYPNSPTVYRSRDQVIKEKGWPGEKVDLYRTLCRLGMEYQYVRKIALLKYFGCTLSKTRSDLDAADAIAKAIEPFAQQDFIMGSMLKLGKMDIMDRYNSNVSSRKVIVSYITLSEKGERYLRANPCSLEFQEGGIPPELS